MLTASGLEEAPQPLAYLLMRQEFAALQGGFTPLHGFHETILFFEVAYNNILHNLIRVNAFLGRALREPGFQVGCKLNFHGFKIRCKRGSE